MGGRLCEPREEPPPIDKRRGWSVCLLARSLSRGSGLVGEERPYPRPRRCPAAQPGLPGGVLGVAAMSHLSESGDSCSSWRAGWGPAPGWGGGWDWASALTPAPWKAEAEDLTWGHEELGDRSAPFCPRTLRIPGLEQPSSSSTVAGGTSPCTPAPLKTDAPAGLPQGRQPWGGARRG